MHLKMYFAAFNLIHNGIVYTSVTIMYKSIINIKIVSSQNNEAHSDFKYLIFLETTIYIDILNELNYFHCYACNYNICFF